MLAALITNLPVVVAPPPFVHLGGDSDAIVWDCSEDRKPEEQQPHDERYNRPDRYKTKINARDELRDSLKSLLGYQQDVDRAKVAPIGDVAKAIDVFKPQQAPQAATVPFISEQFGNATEIASTVQSVEDLISRADDYLEIMTAYYAYQRHADEEDIATLLLLM